MSLHINFIQRKSFRKRVWKTLSVVVGVSTILNVSMVGVLIAPKTAAAATIGPKYPGTVVSDNANGSTHYWVNPSNAMTDDSNYTSVNLGDQETSQYLKATDFGFTIPNDATILGITVDIERKAESGNRIKDNQVSLIKGGTVGSTNKSKSSFWDNNFDTVDYGSTSDLWGETWTPADINAGNFGLVLAAKKTSDQDNAKYAKVNFVRITVNYTQTPTEVPNPPLGQSCGLDIGLVIDSSGSINETELGQMKTAFNGFVDAFLPGTPTQMSVTEFDTTAGVTQPFTTDTTLLHSAINAAVSGGFTNWDDGFAKAWSTFDPRLSKPNLLVFASDGNPNHTGNPASSVTESAAVDAAVTQANAIKTAGTRILALGIGTDLDLDNMKAISGGVGSNVNTGVTSDVITSDFSTLATDLAELAADLCGGKILVQKQFDTNGDGQADVTPDNVSVDNDILKDWSFDVNGAPSNPAAQETPHNGSLEFAVQNGTYSVVETLKDGTTLVSAICKKGDVVIGTFDGTTVSGLTMGTDETITCTFLNAYAEGSLKVTKVVANGAAKPHEFGFRLGTDGAYTYPAADQNYVIFDNLIAGSAVSVNETTGSLPYHQTGNTCVDVPIVAGEQATCTITNSRDVGTLKVIKHVVGGTAVASDWKLHVKHNDVEVTNSPQDGSESGTVYDLPSGTYVVSETNGPTDYTQTFSASCEQGIIDVVNDQQAVCTVTNTRNNGSITVNKMVNESNGQGFVSVIGNTTPFRWQLNGGSDRFMGATAGNLPTGSDYDVTENSVDGYTFVGWFYTNLAQDGNVYRTCDNPPYTTWPTNLTVNTNATTQITLCNVRDTGSITVNKMVDLNGDGNFTSVAGDATPFRWQLDSGSDRFMGSTVNDLPTGSSYDVTENAVDHFDFVGWYYSNQDYSCSQPQFNTLPTDLSVAKDANTAITLCNARDYKDPVTLNAWKIVCTDEADLPNWGAAGGPNITATTAQDWVSAHKSCSLTSGWDFQYAADLPWPGNPGDNTGTAGSPWTTFGPTDANGFTSATIQDFDGIDLLWVREVWQNGYIPFTMGPDYDNSNDVSAEMYCHTDVINYDNFEWINNLQAGQSYNCVAWNVQDKGTVTVTKMLDNDGNDTFETLNPQGWTWELDATTGLAMGSTEQTVMGQHVVQESGPSEGYHFVGWFYDNSESSCEDRELDTSYPININVALTEDTAITLCNARDTGSVDGYKWNDFNGDGVWDENEPALANFRIQTLHGLFAITDANGYYRIDNIPTGTESLVEFAWNGSNWVSPDQLGWVMTYPSNVSGYAALDLTITYGETTHQNFGNFKLGKISGYKYDSQENKLNGWSICLNGLENCVVTGSGEWPTGYYEFTNIMPGTYDVYEQQQFGWQAVSPVSGKYEDVDLTQSGSDLILNFVNRLNDFNVNVVKTGPATVGAAAQATYTLTWSISGNIPVTNVVITDPIPANTTYVSSTCGTTTPTCTPSFASNTASWDLGTRNPGDSGTVTMTLSVLSPLANGTVLSNTGRVCGSGAIIPQTNNREVTALVGIETVPVTQKCDEDTTTTTVTSAPSIGITKTNDVIGFTNPGKQVNYTITVSNAASATDTAHSVVINDTLPAGFTFADTGLATKSTAAGEFALGVTKVFTFLVNISAAQTAGVFTNTATAQGTNTTLVSASSNVDVRVPSVLGVTAVPTLVLTKTVDTTLTNPGKTITYTVTISNPGDLDVTNVRLSDKLPKGFVFADSGLDTKIWDIGTLKAHHQRIINYPVKISDSIKAGQYKNVATVLSNELDPQTAKVSVEVKVPQVLGLAATGASARDYLLFSFGLGSMTLGFYWVARLRRRANGAELA